MWLFFLTCFYLIRPIRAFFLFSSFFLPSIFFFHATISQRKKPLWPLPLVSLLLANPSTFNYIFNISQLFFSSFSFFLLLSIFLFLCHPFFLSALLSLCSSLSLSLPVFFSFLCVPFPFLLLFSFHFVTFSPFLSFFFFFFFFWKKC